MQNFVDVTSIWLKKEKPNTHQVKDAKYYEKDGIKYYVDGKNVILDYSQKEKEVALWLENTFGGKIFMLPQVKTPNNIKTADYLWNNEYWDLKEINGNSIRNIDSKIKVAKQQANNFIIDNSNNLLEDEEAIRQIIKIYNDSKRLWVNKIILINNNRLIYVFQRKKN